MQDFIEFNDTVYVISYNKGVYKVDFKSGVIHLEKVFSETYTYGAHVFDDQIYISGKDYYKILSKTQFKNKTAYIPTDPKGKSIVWDYQTAKDHLYAAAWGIYADNGGVYELTGGKMKLCNADFGIGSTQISSLEYDSIFQILYVGTLDDGFYKVRLDEKIQFIPATHARVLDYANCQNVLATLFNDGLEIEQKQINANQFKQWQINYVKQHPNDLPKYEDHFYELDYDTSVDKIIFYSVISNKDSFWINTSIGMYNLDLSANLIDYLPIHALEFNFTVQDQLLEPTFYHGTRIYESIDPLRYTYYDETKNEQNPRFVVGSLRQHDRTFMTSIFNGLYVLDNSGFNSFIKNEWWMEDRLRFITGLGDGQIAVSNEDGDIFLLDDQEDLTITPISRDQNHGRTITFLTSFEKTLIVGTPKGIVLYNDNREIFLDAEQGIQGKIYNGFVHGEVLHLASDHGSYRVQVAELMQQPNRINNITLQSISVNGTDKTLSNTQVLQLGYDENSLELQVQTNLHPYPQKLSYRYRLDASSKWISMANARLNLPFLNSGDYQLSIRVIDSSTGYHFDQEVLVFHIATPFYKNYWFHAFCVIVFMGFILVHFRLKRKRAQLKSLEQQAITKRIEEVKLEALLSQMNPHFIFNSLNSIQYFISNDENAKAMQYLGKFSELIRANLNSTTQPILTLGEEIEYLKKYIVLENARFEDRVKVSLKVDPQLSETETVIPTMILQPFVENVFIHAFPARITDPILEIYFSKIDGECYCCTITDNGIGRASLDKNKRHVSRGTHLVEERLSFLGYDTSKALKINHSAVGTTVNLYLEL